MGSLCLKRLIFIPIFTFFSSFFLISHHITTHSSQTQTPHAHNSRAMDPLPHTHPPHSPPSVNHAIRLLF